MRRRLQIGETSPIWSLQFFDEAAEDLSMLFWDLVAAVSFLGVIAVAFRGGGPMLSDLPSADQPPGAATVPVPRHPILIQRYVGKGLDEIDQFLDTAGTAKPRNEGLEDA